MILPGKKSEVVWGNGNWIFCDIGFSAKATCGVACGEEQAHLLPFGEACRRIVEEIGQAQNSINFVIEAPLSVAFDAKGNPKGRKIERQGTQTRYWYVGPGAAVVTAATYMLRAVHDSKPASEVRLFEGFVSFKLKEQVSNHEKDVDQLREIVKNPKLYQDSIYSVEDLKFDDSDVLQSAFHVAGLNFGIPAVIMAK